MNSLGQLLKSPTRIEVLRALFSVDFPLGVRALAILAHAHPYAASRVLAELVEEKLVEKTKSQTRPAYRICTNHPEALRLQRFFDADRETLRGQDEEDLSRRAQAFFNFNRQALQMLGQARRSLYGPV